MHELIHSFLHSTTLCWTLKSFQSREHGYFVGDFFQDFILRDSSQFKCLRKYLNFFFFLRRGKMRQGNEKGGEYLTQLETGTNPAFLLSETLCVMCSQKNAHIWEGWDLGGCTPNLLPGTRDRKKIRELKGWEGLHQPTELWAPG